MRPPSLFYAAILCVPTIASYVHDLNSDTFLDFIKENSPTLVEFYAPWCGACQALAPKYDAAAEVLKHKDINLAKVDCEAEANICKDYGVNMYPKLKVFHGIDQVSPYAGLRDAKSIASYMVKHTLPAVSILTKDNIEDFKRSDEIVLIAYFDNEDENSSRVFADAAEILRGKFLLAATCDPSLLDAAGFEVPTVVLYNSVDRIETLFKDTFDAEAIARFANAASVPLFGVLDSDTFPAYKAAQLPLAHVFAESLAERDRLTALLMPLARKYRGLLNFATINPTNFRSFAGDLNLDAELSPAFAIRDMSNGHIFTSTQGQEILYDDTASFIAKFAAGKIEPRVKSQPIPEEQRGPVYIVVGDNYEAIVLDNEKDVLVEFYAPWCPHCQDLEPTYKELAALYFEDLTLSAKVAITKVDVTANYVPGKVKRFPTIKLFPARNKTNPVIFKGPMDVESIIDFIEQHGDNHIGASHPLAGTASSTFTYSAHVITVTETSGSSSTAVQPHPTANHAEL